MTERIEPLTSKFEDAHGDGQGFNPPDYDVLEVPIVLRNTQKGVLVHEDVSEWGDGKEGTGKMSTDAVSYYTNEEFSDKYDDNFVTLKQYKDDSSGIEGAVQSAPSSTAAYAAMDMKNRLAEVTVDLTAYDNHLREQLDARPNLDLGCPQ